jgi:hypothetical protein
MKNHILFSLLGGIVLWLWQFISFAAANLHGSAQAYTPLSDPIISAISATSLPEGRYLLGQVDPDLIASGEATGFENEGGPVAILHWDPVNDQNMALNMIRGFAVCLLVSALLFWLVKSLRKPSPRSGALAGLAIGFMAFLAIPYTNFIWYRSPDIWAYLADAVVPWVLMGGLAGRFVK